MGQDHRSPLVLDCCVLLLYTSDMAAKASEGNKGKPSYVKVYDYWACYCLVCDTHTDTCSDRLGHSIYISYIDQGEPECLRCGVFLGYTPEVIRNEPDCADEAASCQRAHIIAKRRGGGNNVENVAPLCDYCHAVDPEPETRKEWLEWACAERRRQAVCRKQLIETLATAGPTKETLTALAMQVVPFGKANTAHLIAERAVAMFGAEITSD